MRREARVFYRTDRLDETALLAELKKKTRYRSITVKK
jgi:hypothetical protein